MGKSFLTAVQNACLEDSRFHYILLPINGKYKMVI